MGIEAVLFDAAGTLIKTAKPVGHTYAAIADKFGLRVAPSDISARFSESFEHAPPLAFPGAEAAALGELERAWWKHLVRQVFAPFGPFADFDSYFNELFAHFARPDSWELYPEAAETLQTLRARGLKLAVVSNFDSRLVRILDGLGAAALLHGIFFSSLVGYAKPDRRIFDSVLSNYQLPPGKVLHVGDSLAKDIAGASNAGLTAILIDRKGTHLDSKTRRVTSLKEIASHLS